MLADGKVLPLYGTGGFRMIWDTKFDQAMLAFLDCLQQFGHEVEKHGDLILPYEMGNGKVKDNNSNQWWDQGSSIHCSQQLSHALKMFQHRLSVKLQFNSEDLWTKACRHMLTNLKWGLAFAGVKYLKREDASGSAPSPTQVEETVADWEVLFSPYWHQ